MTAPADFAHQTPIPPIVMKIKSTLLGLFVFISSLLGACDNADTTKMLVSARSYLSKNDSAAAVIQLKNALQKNPNLAEARFLLGNALLHDGDPASALIELRRAGALKYPDALVTPPLVKALIADHQEAVALEQYANVDLQQPGATAELKTSIAGIYAVQGNFEKSRAALSYALNAVPDYAPAKLVQARLLARERKYDEALALVESVLGSAPGDLDAMELQGEIYLYGRHDAKDAIAAYSKAIKADPAYVPARIGLITLLLAQNELKAAKEETEKLRKLRPNLPQTAYFEAQLAFLDRDFTRANNIVQGLMRVFPDSSKIMQLAGAIQFGMKSFLEAERSLSRAVQLEPGLPVARRLLARTYLQLVQPTKALTALQPLLTPDSTDSEARKLAAEANLQAGEFEKAQSNFAKAVILDPKDVRSRVALQVGRASGDFASAIVELRRIAESNTDAYADLALIDLYLRRNDLLQAAQAAKALEVKLPNKPMASNILGRIAVMRKDNVGARQSFERALKIDPTYLPAVTNLASLEVAENHPDAAMKRFEDLLTIQPKNVEALLAVAGLRTRAGADPKEVTVLLQKAVKANPGDLAPRLVLVEHLLAQRDAKAALAAAREAAASFSDNPRAVEALGNAELASGDQNQAVRSFTTLASLAPGSPSGHMHLAQLHLAAKDPGAASESLRKALSVQANYLPAQQSLIDIALSERRIDEAMAIAHRIQVQRPDEVIGLLLQGQIEAAGGRLPAAEETYRTALKRFPSTDPAVKLHSVYTASGKDAEAAQLAASWTAAHPSDAVFVSYLGDLALARHDFGEAEKQFRKVLRAQPNSAPTLNNLAWAMIQQKNAGALEIIVKATAMQPSVPAYWDTEASAYLLLNQTSEALRAQGKAVGLAPANTLFRMNLAKLLVHAGDKSKARTELEALAKGGSEPSQRAEASQLLQGL